MELMSSFSAGDVNAFTATMSRSSAAVQAQPALFSRVEFVTEKIKLLALVNMVFEREANDRTLSFAVSEGGWGRGGEEEGFDDDI
jgi:hypothetical protein